MLPGSRSSSKSILSLVLIGVVLCAAPLILYKERLRRVWSLRSSFAQPKYHVQGPPGKNLGEATKSIIAASLKDENTSWIHDNFGADWDLKIYVNDDPQAPLTIPRNKGRESTTYLTYILDHYEDLPDYIVFIHSQRYQWHNEDPMYDGVQVIKNLRLLHVEEEGFCSLRCTHAVGCPKNLHPDPDALHAYDPLAPMLDSNRLYADVFRVLLPNHPLPQVVGASCCSQFALTRAKVLERPKEDYELYRQFLLDTEIDGRHTGRVFEYLWHIIMGKPPVHCPHARDCFCQKFGLCNLRCDHQECWGRYITPPYNTSINKSWPEEGQGVDGWPVDHWWNELEEP